jgi:hypothetical protein
VRGLSETEKMMPAREVVGQVALRAGEFRARMRLRTDAPLTVVLPPGLVDGYPVEERAALVWALGSIGVSVGDYE